MAIHLTFILSSYYFLLINYIFLLLFTFILLSMPELVYLFIFLNISLQSFHTRHFREIERVSRNTGRGFLYTKNMVCAR